MPNAPLPSAQLGPDLPARLALVFIPAAVSTTSPHDPNAVTLAVGTLDEVSAAWDAYLRPVVAPMGLRVAYGYLRETYGVLYALHITGHGSLYVVAASAEHEPCECSEEYGPCEAHGETLVVREGASQRTADESALCLIDDLVGLGVAELSPYGADVVDQARTALDSDRWLDPERFPNLAEELYDVADQVDASAGVLVIRDDGYRIVRASPTYWRIVGRD